MHLGSEPCDHRAVVPAVLPVGNEHLGASRVRHVLDHVAETAVLGHPSSEEHLLLANVGHGALGDLREHREGGLLHGQRYVLQRDPFPAERHRRCNHAGERDIHALDRIGELVVPRTLAGQLLEDGARVESHSEVPS